MLILFLGVPLSLGRKEAGEQGSKEVGKSREKSVAGDPDNPIIAILEKFKFKDAHQTVWPSTAHRSSTGRVIGPGSNSSNNGNTTTNNSNTNNNTSSDNN
mmetsp:Transcript_12826/g.19434  ORF Transcript_12826/g.19434 Transcript_12826/m.19434 type:complete len:100 (-) Transcript_12826:83-382(-)